ncbi:MAG: GWxTD domain-containing protein [Candidatus Cloacimonetes bacterium]|jgi:GWxTD domain-containing protein|nr:GWxTD domain-containing protein [Candidatus Cloacimonadota bacterium]MDD2211281.1 GWxTD domain-containing protein [Candidatus Cloacimonadota bacterium]MDD4232565.1 GWxTD domain-containing protein [Candidatus Cloacimonadota bacterium]MDD4687001.1 GWxTD domain-containing protein [Candidatus Cloacimonadota bacterium]MDY0299334.1 GWxTD domain-containing protein [Candidatus Cloacimonadaceae bacterium]
MNISIIKRILALSFYVLCSLGAYATEQLHMHIDYNRFLTSDKDTVLLLDYQIPYRSLVFLAQNGAYFAEVDIQVQISNRDSVLFVQSITDNIGIRSKYDALSTQKSYLNRMNFILSPQNYNLNFTAKDLNSNKEFNWSFPIATLDANSRISDVELNAQVYPDSSAYLQKFRRNGFTYESLPSIILNREYHEYAHLYLEVYTPETELNTPQLLMLNLEQNGELIMDEYLDFTPQKSIEVLTLRIPLSNLEAGKYRGEIILQAEELTDTRNFDFVLSEAVELMLSLFPDPEDEYGLMRYFMASRTPANWDSMNEEAKRRHITNFWKSMALSTGMSEQNIIDLVHERVEHSNRYYSSLKPGWTTDMGRIYIRNGAPSDIERGTSSDESRFVRKDYQIWKYSSGNRAVYVFIDIQMNNNYRLIYASGDDMEQSNPDWMRFLGSDFDSSLLRN